MDLLPFFSISRIDSCYFLILPCGLLNYELGYAIITSLIVWQNAKSTYKLPGQISSINITYHEMSGE